jgi:hypothetical protein
VVSSVGGVGAGASETLGISTVSISGPPRGVYENYALTTDSSGRITGSQLESAGAFGSVAPGVGIAGQESRTGDSFGASFAVSLSDAALKALEGANSQTDSQAAAAGGAVQGAITNGLQGVGQALSGLDWSAEPVGSSSASDNAKAMSQALDLFI